jgi:predicted DNA-binding transcriptional regulator YafY
LLKRTGDSGLKHAADRVTDKIAAAMPQPLRQTLSTNAIYAWGSVAPQPEGVDLAQVRQAISDEQKLFIYYRDEGGNDSERTVRPIALIYYSHYANIVAWCELRQDIRNFRTDRVAHSRLVADFFSGQGDALRRQWIAGWEINRPQPA